MALTELQPGKVCSSRRASAASHLVEGELEQAFRVEQEAVRVADAAAAVLRLRQIRVDDLREEAIGPVRVRAGAAGIDFLHFLPDPLAVLEPRHFHRHDPEAGHVEDVLGVMQEGHGVVIAADQQDLAVELDEPFERRAAAERKIPGCSEIRWRAFAPHTDEARDVVVDERSRIRTEELDERAVVARRARGRGIERRHLVEDLALDRARIDAASDVVVVVRAARIHHHRAAIGERVLDREVNLIRAAGDLADRPHRGVDHDGVARRDTEWPRRRRPAPLVNTRGEIYTAGFAAPLVVIDGASLLNIDERHSQQHAPKLDDNSSPI